MKTLQQQIVEKFVERLGSSKHLDALQSRAAQMRDKYTASLAADDKEREQIRADMRARTAAITSRT